MARKGGLGKGLDALIPGSSASVGDGNSLFIPVDKIIPNPLQPRHVLDRDGLQELSDSIRQHGVLQPLLVTYEPQNEQYILVAGERRLRAAQMAGLEFVPVVIRQVTDQERLELALVENVQRSDLTPLETAEAYRQLNEEFKLSHEEISSRVGKSRVSVTNTLRLLKLPETIRKALAEGRISEGHARALLALNSPQAQVACLETISKYGLNVRKTEELVRKFSGEKMGRPSKSPTTPEIKAVEERLRNYFDTKVTLRHGKNGGSLVIYYYSDDDLDAVLKRILKE
ncbi:MAG TPA: ParB/RepB/Spo0J family partition protein [Anaerolineaceae bacterium]|nr:ParB/RepB/Spo0J family partition protein [Anaerolineaceae bacterium]